MPGAVCPCAIVVCASLLVRGMPQYSSKPCCEGSRPSGRSPPRCHLPKSAVAYPTDFSASAMVTSHSVMPPAWRGAGANGVASGHQRRARDGAGELDVEVVEPDALGRHAVDARRQRAADAPVGAHFAPSKVIGKDQDDIRTSGLRTEEAGLSSDCTREHEPRTHDERRQSSALFHIAPQVVTPSIRG